MIVYVALGIPVETTFKYSLPLDKEVKVGARVIVPFRNSEKVGYVVKVEKADMEGLRPVKEVLDEEPIIDEDLLKLTLWMADRYYASWGECIEAALPSILKKGKKFAKPRQEYFVRPEVGFERPQRLTTAQAKALKSIRERLREGGFEVFLLYGVTGSGKTEIYLRAIEIALDMGKGCIMLVPEIALTPQTIARFQKRFGRNISVLHSGLTEAQRFQEWKRLKEGQVKICVGARSAIFAPVRKLGLIIIDEEHDPSYKQDETPRYHVRDVAERRAQISNCPLILGSATPSLESYYKAQSGKYKLLELPERIRKKEMPQVLIVNLKEEKRRGLAPLIFSKVLKEELIRALDNKMQVILFLNRRGFSTYISCLKCGYVAKCPNCDLSLTYHSKEGKLLCHYCGYKEARPSICPNCRGRYLTYRGFGTQRVESELHKLFPGIRTARLDSDAIRKRGRLEQIIQDFRDKKIDVLVGTQIVAKGHDFPDVELVGILLADLSLNIIDFRAGERTFSLLTQVAGRSGRGESRGKVIIQTYAPEHYTIRTSLSHDYKKFYEEEIKRRKALGFPPFSELIKLELKHKKEDKVRKASEQLHAELSMVSKGICEILGPAPHPVPKIRNVYRWNLILKGKNVEGMLRLVYNIIGFKRRYKGVEVSVDVNPYED